MRYTVGKWNTSAQFLSGAYRYVGDLSDCDGSADSMQSLIFGGCLSVFCDFGRADRIWHPEKSIPKAEDSETWMEGMACGCRYDCCNRLHYGAGIPVAADECG